MKHFILMAVVAIALSSGACSTDSVPTGADPDPVPTAGELHNRFLKTAKARVAKGTPETVACMEVANEMLAEYDVEPMTLKEIQSHIEYGKHLARSVEDFDMTDLLIGDDLEWWNRFVDEATVANARVIYEEHCRRHGLPAKGGNLELLATVAVSSAEFWSGEGDLYQNGEKFPTEILRFCLQVIVDAIATALASAGSGPLGVILGPIIGGLASWGAECIVFGGKAALVTPALEAV